MSKKKQSKLRCEHKKIAPRSENQRIFMELLLSETKPIVFGIGPAGTGKTLIAVSHAIECLKNHKVDKIIITRPVVTTDEELGFLPGTLEEKMDPFIRPIYDVFCEHFAKHAVDDMIKSRTIEISPLAYMRGRTFKQAYIIADETQNATVNQMKMLLTRIGDGSRMVVTGDLNQTDCERNGLLDFLEILPNNNKYIDVVEFDLNDVTRHPAVAEVLGIYEQAEYGY